MTLFVKPSDWRAPKKHGNVARKPVDVERKARRSFGLDNAFPVDEETIHKSVLDWLRLVLPTALIFHVPNGGSREIREASKLKRLGTLAGIPDIFVFTEGGFAGALEIKTQAGRLSSEQHNVHSHMRRLGFKISVVRGIVEAREALASWGLKTRESVV